MESGSIKEIYSSLVRSQIFFYLWSDWLKKVVTTCFSM